MALAGDSAIWVAGFAMVAAIATPFVTNYTLSSARRKDREDLAEQTRLDKEQDWKRQDQVAERAARLGEELKIRQDTAAEQAKEAARLLLEAQEKTAAQAKEAARLLAVTNQKLDTRANIQEAKLDQIHSLVNSNLTASMQDQLDALKLLLISLESLWALQTKSGAGPTEEAKATILETKRKITELNTQLANRLKQTEEAARQLKQDMKVAVPVKVEIVNPQPVPVTVKDEIKEEAADPTKEKT